MVRGPCGSQPYFPWKEVGVPRGPLKLRILTSSAQIHLDHLIISKSSSLTQFLSTGLYIKTKANQTREETNSCRSALPHLFHQTLV
jgi:hypothetical protein